MEGVPFDLNDYLRSEGLSGIAPTGLGMQGGQTGQDGAPMHEWQDQQLASGHKSDNADGSQGYNTGEISLLGHEEGLIHGSTSYLETSKPESDPTPPEQAPSSIVSPIETGPNVFTQTQKVQDLGVILPDQICVCAACLGYNHKLHLACLKWQDEYPDSLAWTFGCRVAGCQWTTKSADAMRKINVMDMYFHEMDRSHYGKPGSWRCREANCKFISKRFNDLKRHSSSKHCIKPKNLKCPVLGCRYHEDGFARKDKLDSHYQNVHGGKSQPGKPNQAIKPKVGDCA